MGKENKKQNQIKDQRYTYKTKNQSTKTGSQNHHEASDSVVAGLWLAAVDPDSWSISFRDASHRCCSIPSFLNSYKPRSTMIDKSSKLTVSSGNKTLKYT